jgi:hypothetical protein
MDPSFWANQVRGGANQIIVAKAKVTDEMPKEGFADGADSNGCAEFAEHACARKAVVGSAMDEGSLVEGDSDIDDATVIADPLFDGDADGSDWPAADLDAGRRSIRLGGDAELSQDVDDRLVEGVAIGGQAEGVRAKGKDRIDN